jgi:hypothetical protein
MHEPEQATQSMTEISEHGQAFDTRLVRFAVSSVRCLLSKLFRGAKQAGPSRSPNRPAPFDSGVTRLLLPALLGNEAVACVPPGTVDTHVRVVG